MEAEYTRPSVYTWEDFSGTFVHRVARSTKPFESVMFHVGSVSVSRTTAPVYTVAFSAICRNDLCVGTNSTPVYRKRGKAR